MKYILINLFLSGLLVNSYVDFYESIFFTLQIVDKNKYLYTYNKMWTITIFSKLQFLVVFLIFIFKLFTVYDLLEKFV